METTAETTTEITTEDTTSVTTEETTAETEELYKEQQLIPDVRFKSGFTLLSQKDNANGDKVTQLATHSFYGDEVTSPRWMLAQWDSGPCLVENMKDAGAGEITDGQWRSLKYDTLNNVMSFHLDTSLYYNGNPAKSGDYWPHLLIEQSSFGYSALSDEQKAFYRCSADKIVFSMDIKLDEYSVTPIQGDWVKAAQFLIYFYVKGTETNDFCWFGVQLFDNRWQTNDNYIGYDGGKADASGAMIFSVGSKYIYGKKNPMFKKSIPAPGGDWVHIEIDLNPFLEKMLETGKKDGYFKADTLDGLCINGMNLGWETIATFNNTISVRDLALTSYIRSD